ncbi:two-component regulator propeller domain-containing protein [Flavicella sediminum]|uniref:two-component regulator propeller domain-containing protein n=1 Tax=Flavicella sediminum TaxID=2585141 RepID=UPI001120F308|nr:two-component regulator propeller domain-containing protein [Flavicella sediminum]
MNKILQALVLNFVVIGFLNAQRSLGIDHLSSEDGLSQNDVNCIYQDKQGFMWFGTHDGLNRYDGYAFRVYNLDPSNPKSINSNLIMDVVGDKTGNLWIGTTGSGLNYFDKSTEEFRHFMNDKNNPSSLSNDYLTSVYIDKSNHLWVGTKNGINMLDLDKSLDSVTFQKFKFNHGSDMNFSNKIRATTVHSFFEDENYQLWACTGNGLYKLLVNNIGDFYFQRVNKSLGLPITPVRSMAADAKGKLYFGTGKGVYSLSNQSDAEKVTLMYPGSFQSIIVDKGFLWGGSTNGLFQIRLKDNKLLTRSKYDPENPINSISKNSVKSLYSDKTGVIWLGLNGGGVNKFDPKTKRIKHIRKTSREESLSNDKIRAIFEDSNKDLWIGTEGGGLNLLLEGDTNSNNRSFQHFKNALKVFSIAEIVEGDKKKLFVGGEQIPGLLELDITKKQAYNEKDFVKIKDIKASVFSILQDSKQNIWTGTYSKGVYRWLTTATPGVYKKTLLEEDPNNPTSIPNNIIRDICEDQEGNIWFGTGDGLCKLEASEIHENNPKMIVYKNDKTNHESLSHNYVMTIFESSLGDLWIGTLGGGLNKYIPPSENKKGKFIRYSIKDGLPNNAIKGILEDNQKNLWVSTNKGLSKFNPATETFKNYDVNDGLQSNEFGELACFKKEDGEFLFGGVNGYNVFNPSKLYTNKINPETVFTGFSIFKKNVQIGEEVNGRVILEKSINEINEIELKYEENSFSFEFAALHYAAPNKNQYAYKLEGFKDDWIYTTSKDRFATYTNLEPGSYTLKVKASNNDGVWDDSPATLKIIVTPPIWRTQWAKFIYLLIFIGLLVAFRRFTVIKTSKKFDLEFKSLEKEKNDEIHRLKLEFFTNISHEFRTPLTLIKGPLDFLLKEGDAISPKEVKDKYKLMQKNTNYLLRLINQLLDFRKMDKGKLDLMVSKNDIVQFLKDICEPFQFLSHKKRIEFKLEASNEKIATWFDSNALEKIVNNLLSNAFKFTPEEGEVQIDVMEGDKSNGEIKNKYRNIDFENYILIKVKDSGPGIPAHRISHVFERFYVEVDKIGVNKKGAGIGLSYTKNLVELHQGIIDVSSDPKEGTTFFVWLPKNKEAYENKEEISLDLVAAKENYVSQTDAESHAISVIDDIVDKNISRSRSKLPVLLIVDDNEDIRSFVKQVLGEEYYIYEAENGKQGLEVANKVLPNVIVTDLMMPIMDGVELCEKLKTAQETSHIPVVMLTAKLSQEWEIEGLKTGADGYIRKPFDMELLRLKLSNILKNRAELRKRFNREITLQPNEVTVTSADEKFLQNAIKIVEEHMADSEFSVEMLVKEMCLSRSNLYLKLKEITGLSSSEFIRNIRLKRAMQLIESSDLSIKEIMYNTGFSTGSYFSKCFKKQFGVIPSKYVRDKKNREE